MAKAVYPSSLGLSFCVPHETTALKVTARLGHYDKAPSEFLTNPKTGRPKRVWKRRRAGQTQDAPHGRVGRSQPADDSFPDVYIKGLVRRRPDHWCVTLFLVNDGRSRAEPGADLGVSAGDGARA